MEKKAEKAAEVVVKKVIEAEEATVEAVQKAA